MHRIAGRSLIAIVVAASPLGSASLQAQTPAAKFVDSARVEIEAAGASRDTARLSRAELLLDRALVAFPGDPYVLHYRGYAAYRHAIAHFTAGNVKGAANSLALAADHLNRSTEKLPWPETYALLASVTGMTIGTDPSRAMELGQEIGPLQARAMQLGPNNPRVALIIGEGLANTPPEWGGGADKAKEMLTRAITLFESDKPAPLAPSWGRDEAIAQLKALGGAKSP